MSRDAGDAPGQTVDSGDPGMDTSPALRRRALSISTFISLAFAVGFLVFLVFRFDLDLNEIGNRLRNADLKLFLLAILVHYTTFFFRGARWRVLLRNVRTGDERLLPAWHAGLVILVSWFANSITFLRLGDAYRAIAYAEDSGGSFSRTMGTVMSERLLDVAVVFLLLLGSAFMIYTLPGEHPSYLFLLLALGLGLAGVLGLGMMLVFRDRLARMLPKSMAGVYERFHHGVTGSLKVRQLPAAMGWGALGWVSEFTRLYLVIQALGLDLALPWVVFVTLANALLTLVPVTPGGLGVVEAGVAGVLALSMPVADAAVVAVLDRIISYLSVVVFGGLAFFLRQAWRSAQRRKARQQPTVPV